MRQYSYKLRLYPNSSQREFLARQFGCCRLVYNYMLELKQNAFKEGNKLSKFDLIKQLTTIKKDYPFLKEVHAWALQNAISNMDKAFINWFKHRANAPKFKSRKAKQSYSYMDPSVKDGKLWLQKHKSWIKFSDGRIIEGKLKKVTISKYQLWYIKVHKLHLKLK